MRSAWEHRDIVRNTPASRTIKRSRHVDQTTIWALVGLIMVAITYLVPRDVISVIFQCVLLSCWLCWLGIHIARAKTDRKWPLVMIVVISSVLASGVGWLVFPTIRRNADVALESLGFHNDPNTGHDIQFLVRNNSDFGADNEKCIIFISLVDIKDGWVSREIQDSAWSDFKRKLPEYSPETPPMRLEAHQERVGILEKDASRLASFVWWVGSGRKTILYTGIITWSDEDGLHEKELCGWIVPPVGPLAELTSLHRRGCYGHNAVF